MMRKITLIEQLFIVLIGALSFSNSSLGQIVTNDIQETEAGQFRINGGDPYIIFSPQHKTADATHIVFDLGDDIINMPLELFFVSENDVFKPHYRLSFVATGFPAALVIPEDINLSSLTRLRLDVNECSDCVIKLKTLPVLSNAHTNVDIIEPTTVLNGIKQLSPESGAISISGWRLNDLDGDISNFKVSGSDPYLVSPRLNTSTHQLAGVYFKLKGPRSGEVWNNYQLFYQTEQHPFTRHASSALRTTDSLDGITEFVVPLDFLSKELPSVSMLERIRLDLPEIAGLWSIIDAKLIHDDNLSEVKHLIPSQLIHTKKQRARRFALIKKSLINVASDIAFSISYILLLMAACFFFVRTYRSNA